MISYMIDGSPPTSRCPVARLAPSTAFTYAVRLVAGVNKDARIPLWLEKGTRYMHDRPFIAPSIKVVKPKVVDIIELQMDKAIKRMRTRAMRAAQ